MLWLLSNYKLYYIKELKSTDRIDLLKRDDNFFQDIANKFDPIIEPFVKPSPTGTDEESYDNFDQNLGEDYWSCEICGGDQNTGCLYFDPTECPKRTL